ncbi:MAG TPA: AbrB/MazE/SpoVT family DNA-binding domain-containing protein [Dehalococcoidia bacterium]|nr:AbrB/MazE/SpoVT family DNA-binding domain-containing protein [Dehalococcoidia bacterium]
MAGKLFKSGSGLALIIPRELAERYYLKPGDLVETIATEKGLLVRPVELVPRLSKEWEEALDSVVERYRPALEMLGE